MKTIFFILLSTITLTGCSSNIYKLGMSDEEWKAWIDSAPKLESRTYWCKPNCSWNVSYFRYPDGRIGDVLITDY